MRRKEELPREQLIQNTSNGPDVGLVVPSHAVENHLWTSVLPCVDDGAVVLVVPGCSAHVNEFYLVVDWFVGHFGHWAFGLGSC